MDYGHSGFQERGVGSRESAFELALRSVGLTWQVNVRGEHFQQR